MAKRRTRKKKRPSIASKFGISQRQYTTLRDESAKARRRIRDFAKRPDAQAFFVPDAEDYLLENLLNRIQSGDKVSSIVKEVKGLTAKKIISGTPVTVETLNEYSLTPAEKRRVTAAVKQANEAIRQARKDFDFAVDILPEEFDAKNFVENIASKESLTLHLEGLRLFTKENLVPTTINEAGEAGTKAEYEYYKRILERENERRAKLRELTDPTKTEGYFIQQSDYEKRNIDISKIEGMEQLKKRAETWDDKQRLYRANRYLANYLQGMEHLEVVLRSNGLVNDKVEEQFSFMYETLAMFMNDEEAITYASNRMPFLQIQNNYVDAALAGSSLMDIVDAWKEMRELFG